MKRIFSSGWFVVAVGVAVGLACGSTKYYMVKDPSTGKVYYTEKVKKEDGSTTLTDAKTKSTVTIQNSEVTEISEQSFEQGMAAAPAAAPAEPPAAMPAPAATGPATSPSATPPPAR
ncbi:MAG: hypothetical protein ACXWK8_05825 [Myxococcaceae bacterium]